ncbi:MAG: glycosyltransferase family 1 protein [Brevundimonas sp.]|uniref:glycosyltransferase family 4 protein n=1 Tax=Brevundimonas sp. TaxID=1871086 RepID=UPI0030017347
MTRVCIDAMNIGLAKGSGIATYGRNLIEGLNGAGFESQILYGPGHNYAKRPILNEIALVDPVAAKGKKWRDRRELILTPLGATARPVPISENVVWPVRGGGRPKVQDFWSAPRLFGRADQWWGLTKGFTPVSFQGSGETRVPDIMHWTTVMPLRARGVANLYTIHDLIPLKLPHATLDNKRRFLRIARDIARRADHIAVVSEATRRDVITLLGVPEDRVTNTWQAVSVPPKHLARTEEEVARELEGVFRLPWKGYFLWFGALEPKKNLARVVEAYLAANIDMPLVIVGGRAWLEEDEVQLMHQARQDKKVRKKKLKFFQYLPFSVLVSLIRGARGTLFPSLYEGFGLPVLESMVLGTPVMTSNVSSLPEVAGDAALMVDPYDVHAMTRHILALASDDDLCAELSARGRVQAAKFSPEAYQERLRTMYAKLA